MSKNITTIEKSAIEYLCGLIRELSSVSEGIDDINLKTNGTFSSVKIDTLLNNLETDCNDYTDKLVSNLSRLELKIVTNEADINKSNIMYLYKPDGATSYNQYVVIEGNKVLLGTTDISMTDYYTITQADAKFCLLTDYNSLKTAYEAHKNDTDIHVSTTDKAKWDKVTDKVDKTNIVDNLTSTNTDKPLSANQGKVLKGEVDKKANDNEVIKKTAITTTINSASTDTQVPSAKSVYNKVGKYKIYNASDLGITNSTTLPEMVQLMPDYSILYVNWNPDLMASNSKWYSEDVSYGVLEIVRNTSGFIRLEHTFLRRKFFFEGNITDVTGNIMFLTRLCTTSVEDMSPSEISSFVDTSVSGTVNYRVKNGICFVKLWGIKSTTIGAGKFLLNNLSMPIPSCFDTGNALFEANGDGTANAFAFVDANGALIVHFYKANSLAYGTFSYPVKES